MEIWKRSNKQYKQSAEEKAKKDSKKKNKWVSIYKDKFKAITVSDHRYFSQ